MDKLKRFEAEAAKYNALKAELEAQEKRTTAAAYDALAAREITREKASQAYGIGWPTLNRRLKPLEQSLGRLPVLRYNQYSE